MKTILMLLLLALPCLSQTLVVDAGDVEINSQTYNSARLTYTFDKPIQIEGWSFAKVEKLKGKATKLTVDYKENGQNARRNFFGKMPKVKKLKISQNEKPIKPENGKTEKKT